MADEAEPPAGEDAVERHKVDLVAKAIDLRHGNPDQRIVGLVAEADAPEAPSLREAPAHATIHADGSVSVVLTRESALNLLGAETPGLLDWIEDEDGGPRRRLPVIHAAQRGMRTTTIEYDAPD